MSKDIELEVAGEKLTGKLYEAERPRSLAVLLLHGWTGMPNAEAAQALADHGYSAMTFSLSGHNDSTGKLEEQTRTKSEQEVLEAYDFFRDNLPPEIKIGVVGTSYGGYLAAVLTGDRELAFVQLRVPANYPDEGSDQPQLGQGSENPAVMDWRQKALDPLATKSLAALHNFSGPIQIIEAELDDYVPHQTVQNYVDAVADKQKLDYHFMKGWPHSLGIDPARNKQYQDLLIGWLDTVKL
jgi:esterase/lipase